MLQIISGKFFRSDDVYKSNGLGITYSNYSWTQAIKTCIGELEPAETYGNISSYVIRYVNQLERRQSPGFALVKTGDRDIAYQFRLLCTFGLKAFFDLDRILVESMCREQTRYSKDDFLPSKYVNRSFDKNIHGTQSEIDYFVSFINKTIGLSRQKYNSVINCISTFVLAQKVLPDNLDLAYTILVYCLESLCQKHDEFTATWDDYKQDIRNKLESCFSRIDADLACEIKSHLISHNDVRLQTRFLAFSEKYIKDTYFTSESKGIVSALRKSELRQALINAYEMRSKYVHELKPIQNQLRIPEVASGDIFHWSGQPYLTFGGLTRLIHHIICNFVYDQEYLEKEEFNYWNEIPGSFLFEAAPQYWIWKDEGFESKHAVPRFSGFLSHFQDVICNNSAFTDMKKLLIKVEALFAGAKKTDKLAMMAMYCLYNNYIVEESKLENHSKFIEKNQSIFDECSIESMIVLLFHNFSWPWSLEEVTENFEKYRKKKYKENSLKIPAIIEIFLICEIANMFLKQSDYEGYNIWMDNAIFDSSGKEDIQNKIIECKDKQCEFDYNEFLTSKRESTQKSIENN